MSAEITPEDHAGKLFDMVAIMMRQAATSACMRTKVRTNGELRVKQEIMQRMEDAFDAVQLAYQQVLANRETKQ